MKRIALSLSLLLLALAPGAFAVDHCSNYQFCGSLTQLRADGPATLAGWGFSVNICAGRDGGQPCYPGNVTCPNDGSSCMYQAGPLVAGCTLPQQTWYLSAYSWDGSNWGQQWVSIAKITTYGNCPTRVVNVGVPPRPLVPVLYNPHNGQLVPVSSTSKLKVQWYSSVDAPRDTQSWPVTYVVSQKYWPSNTNEPGDSAYQVVYSGPCQPFLDRCMTEVDVSVLGEYRIKVDARMDVSASVSPSLAPVVYTNNSHDNRYTVYTAGRCLGCGR